jgi:hypothetical protein
MSNGSRTPQATLSYGGDGHDHWHLHEFQHYVLEHLQMGASVAVGMKGGYCFFDTDAYRLSLPGAPRSPVTPSQPCVAAVPTGLPRTWAYR